MKTIVDSNNCSKYLLKDDKNVSLNTENIEVSTANELLFIIGDLNKSNSTVVENVSAPSDWAGCKYIFDGTDWEVSSDWVEPEGEPV